MTSRLPLRTQLTVAFAALLVTGLVLSGLVAHTLLRQSLVGQLDTQLGSVAPRLLEELGAGLPQRGSVDSTLPSDYVVAVADEAGQPVRTWSTRSTARSRPEIPALTVEEVVEAEGAPFTVTAETGSERWRALARPLATPQGEVIGSVVVALPMTGAQATLDQMRTALLLIGAAVVVPATVAGWFAVRRSLRPLNEIEDTAAAIADGDLSRRVPTADPGTEVGHLSASLNRMLGQLEQSFAERTASQERMRRFVADAGHELRTPLATIRGYGELYRMGAVTDEAEVRDTFRRIEGAAGRMGVLVEDLMHLARLDEGRPLAREPVDLAVLATDALADLRALDPGRPVSLVPLGADGTARGAVVRGDEGRLRQVLANLVGNVVQHTPAGTPAEVAVGRVGDLVRLEVRDHGPGIPAEHAARVFERFYRVDPGRSRESGGAGLGMAIVSAIVTAHRGEVDLAATPGGGTTVRVAFPCVVTPGPEE